MRKQLVEKKLTLKKETISHLDNSAMDTAKGGITTICTSQCAYSLFICYTNPLPVPNKPHIK